MNDTLKTIKNRTTCRKYQDKQITDQELDLILEAGSYAPSGRNQQSAIMIAIQDKEVLKEMSKINGEIMGSTIDPFFGAPTVIAVLANPNIIGTFHTDGAVCVENMLLAAESLGLGSACIHRAKEEFETPYGKALLKKLGIDEGYVGIENVLVGYIDGEKALPKERLEKRIYKI